MQVITENCSPEVSAELKMVQLLCLHKHALQQWQSDVSYSKTNFLILNKRFLNGTNIITNTQTCLTKKANIFHAWHIRLRIQQSMMMKLHPQQRPNHFKFSLPCFQSHQQKGLQVLATAPYPIHRKPNSNTAHKTNEINKGYEMPTNLFIFISE